MTQPIARALFFLLLSGFAASDVVADALTNTLTTESKHGTVAAKNEKAAKPVTATIDGVVVKNCLGGRDAKPCVPYFYIVLPNQLDALMSGQAPMPLARCKELGMPMGCAKGIQIEMKEKTFETLDPLTGKRVSVSGVVQENTSGDREFPAIMHVQVLKPL